MKETLITLLIIIAIVLITWNTTAYRDVDYLQKAAPAYVEECGFTITGIEGYSGDYGHGGAVWFLAQDTSGYLYQFCVKEWRGELHMYNLKCLNAVTNK